jgi:GT2 family glycosyltransferase
VYSAIESAADVGIMGTSLIGTDGVVQNSCFRDHSPLSEFLRGANSAVINRCFGREPFPLMPPAGAANFDWVSFASAVIRRGVADDIGVLDEGYFLYFDDADYCRMARNVGWKVNCCREARVVHHEGQSNDVPATTRMLRRRPRYYYVSRSRYFAKHYGAVGLWAANLAWAAGSIIGWVKRLLGNRQPHTCEAEWKDNWTNAWSPIAASNASLIPNESRVVVSGAAS